VIHRLDHQIVLAGEMMGKSAPSQACRDAMSCVVAAGLWTIFSGPFFMVTLEHITAARHNEFLKARLVERTRDFHASLDGIWRHFFSESELGTLEVETTFNATLCLLRGMGVQTVLRNDPEYYRRLLRFWKSMLIEQIATSRRSPAATVKKG
jgi:hypothetical protein